MISKTPDAPIIISLSGTPSAYAVMVKGRKKVFVKCFHCGAWMLKKNLDGHSKKHKAHF